MNMQDKIKKRYEGCQSFLTEGCLFLSLCSIGEQVTGLQVDILGVLQWCKEEGYIDKNNDLSAQGQLALLEKITGKTWKRGLYEPQELPNPVPAKMYTIEKWRNPRTRFTHFRRRFVDTLVASTTVKEGKLEYYYAYTHN